MKRIINECCGCAAPAYPCLGNSCPLRNVEHYFCDNCDSEDVLYFYEGQELCIGCIESKLFKVN